MNYRKKLFISHLAAALLAVGLAYAFATASNPIEQATCAVLFPLTFVLPAVASSNRFVNAVQRVTQAIQSKD